MNEKLRPPKVSVILAARDEERNIQKCLDSLVSQDYPSYEIIAVDDASIDGTTEIISKFAMTSPSKVMAVIRQDNPPEGWTGKNWACFQGYQASSGQILLFTDADAVYSSDTISLAVGHMTSENLDALTARPRIFSDNLLTRIVLPFVWIASHVFCSAMKVNNPKSKTGFVFGGFYLITRKAYESLGTHQSIKSEISEDLEIGRRLKHESKGNVDDEKCTPDAHYKKYHLKMFLGNQNILNSFAPDNAALYSAIRRTVIPSFRKQPVVTCLSGVVQFFILILPWIVLPISVISFISLLDLNSGASHLLPGSVLLLSLDLVTICFIFASSLAISKLSLMQDPKYVWASPIACFYIFGTTALSIIAAAGTASISWKNRTYKLRG